MSPRFTLLSLAALLGAAAAAQAQTITVTSPTNNAHVLLGAPCQITWTSEALPSDTLVEIAISVPGHSTDQPVAAYVPVSAGQYQFHVPWVSRTGSNCQAKIAVQGSGKYFYGPNFFIVTNLAPALFVRAPAGGEPWPRGATRSVSWEHHNLDGTLTLKLLQGTNVLDTVSGLPIAPQPVSPMRSPSARPIAGGYTLQLASDAAPSITATSVPFSVTGPSGGAAEMDRCFSILTPPPSCRRPMPTGASRTSAR